MYKPGKPHLVPVTYRAAKLMHNVLACLFLWLPDEYFLGHYPTAVVYKAHHQYLVALRAVVKYQLLRRIVHAVQHLAIQLIYLHQALGGFGTAKLYV